MLQNRLLARLAEVSGDQGKADEFLEGIKQEKPRYARDQYKMIGKAIDELDKAALSKALAFCTENRLYSAVDFKDAAEYFKKMIQMQDPAAGPDKDTPPEFGGHMPDVEVSRREIGEYIRNLGGGNVKCLN